MMRDGTLNKLDVLGKAVMKWSPAALNKISSVAEFVASSIEKRYLAEVYDNYYEFDKWHTPLSWQATKEGDATTIKIISAGANRIFENGEGDDLSVVIHFDGTGIAKMVLHPKP
jgi:hypothetical protein